MKKLSKEQILMLHTQLIQQTGGSDGVRDYNLLDSALETPFQSFSALSKYTHFPRIFRSHLSKSIAFYSALAGF